MIGVNRLPRNFLIKSKFKTNIYLQLCVDYQFVKYIYNVFWRYYPVLQLIHQHWHSYGIFLIFRSNQDVLGNNISRAEISKGDHSQFYPELTYLFTY